MPKTLDKGIWMCYSVNTMRNKRDKKANKESYLSILSRLLNKGMSKGIAEHLAFDYVMGRRKEA